MWALVARYEALWGETPEREHARLSALSEVRNVFAVARASGDVDEACARLSRMYAIERDAARREVYGLALADARALRTAQDGNP